MIKVVELTDKRVLARTLVYGAGVRKLALADRCGDGFCVDDFDHETANTVFADGVVLAVRRACFKDVLAIEDFKEMLKSLCGINEKMLYETIAVSKKAASDGEAAKDVVLFLLECY